jgi:hypothetical protein
VIGMRELENDLRQRTEENAKLRKKLAHHEFRQLERELTSADPFALDIRVPDTEAPDVLRIPDVSNPLLPCLPVPLGTIQHQDGFRAMPVIAVHDDGLTGRQLATALLGLMRTQYRDPFARIVFLCSSFEAVPLLARYGFLAEHVGSKSPAESLERVHRRYGAREIRSLGTGAIIAGRRDD